MDLWQVQAQVPVESIPTTQTETKQPELVEGNMITVILILFSFNQYVDDTSEATASADKKSSSKGKKKAAAEKKTKGGVDQKTVQ